MSYIFANNCNRNTPDCTGDVWILANVIEIESETWCQWTLKSHSTHINRWTCQIFSAWLTGSETSVFMLLAFVWCVFVSWNNRFFQSIYDMFFICSGWIRKTWCEVKLFENLNVKGKGKKKIHLTKCNVSVLWTYKLCLFSIHLV